MAGGQGFVLMKDNDLKLTSNLYNRYIKSKDDSVRPSTDILGAQSADLNPFKLVSDKFDLNVSAEQPTNAVHLCQFLQESWTFLFWFFGV